MENGKKWDRIGKGKECEASTVNKFISSECSFN